VELYVDRPKEAWTKNANGEIEMVTVPLDIESILEELDSI
jgi:catechol-2,3-dioxygenase